MPKKTFDEHRDDDIHYNNADENRNTPKSDRSSKADNSIQEIVIIIFLVQPITR